MEIAEILKLRQNANGLNKLMNMHVITLDKDGGATVEVELTDELLNPLGMAHGGTIFTLCDIAAGSAAASQGTVAVTPPYTFVIWPRISSSFRSRRMVFLDTPKTSHNSSMLTVSREITYCSMEFNRLTFIFMLLLEKYPNKSTMYLHSLSNYAQVVYCTESQKSGVKFGEKAKRQAV